MIERHQGDVQHGGIQLQQIPYPFFVSESDNVWRHELDLWLAALATHIFEASPFEMGLIGFEIEYATINAASLRENGIPGDRRNSILWPSEGRLTCYPQTRNE